MKSDSYDSPRFQPYNLRRRTDRVNYSPWFPDIPVGGSEVAKPFPKSKQGINRKKKCASRSKQPLEAGSNDSAVTHVETEAFADALLPSSPQGQCIGGFEEPSVASETRSVQGMINYALLELRPTLRKLDESTSGLEANLESIWPRIGWSAGTAGTEKMRTIFELQAGLNGFMGTTETVIDQIISVCDCALHAMEEGDVGHLVPSVGTLWSQPTGKPFCTANGSSLTLSEAIQYVHDKMAQLFGKVEDQMIALEEFSRTTCSIRRSISVSQPTSLGPLVPVPNDDTDDGMIKALTDRCTQTENMIALAKIAFQSFERRLKLIMKPTQTREEVTYIDARLVRSGLKKMKEMRQKSKEDSDHGVQSVEGEVNLR
ncbi:hypothetical protein AAF712_014655 [Marasmius tenuissimus]|uniref:Uncharacterized protein n=1 Tax=Marasmius tenuissimus TaxID=585030 RepID=A0ABR2ZBR1_9AGAR